MRVCACVCVFWCGAVGAAPVKEGKIQGIMGKKFIYTVISATLQPLTTDTFNITAAAQGQMNSLLLISCASDGIIYIWAVPPGYSVSWTVCNKDEDVKDLV